MAYAASPAVAGTVTVTGTTSCARDGAVTVTLALAVPTGRPEGSTVTVSCAGTVPVADATVSQGAEAEAAYAVEAPAMDTVRVTGPLPCSAVSEIDAGLAVSTGVGAGLVTVSCTVSTASRAPAAVARRVAVR